MIKIWSWFGNIHGVVENCGLVGTSLCEDESESSWNPGLLIPCNQKDIIEQISPWPKRNFWLYVQESSFHHNYAAQNSNHGHLHWIPLVAVLCPRSCSTGPASGHSDTDILFRHGLGYYSPEVVHMTFPRHGIREYEWAVFAAAHHLWHNSLEIATLVEIFLVSFRLKARLCLVERQWNHQLVAQSKDLQNALWTLRLQLWKLCLLLQYRGSLEEMRCTV